MLAVTAETLGEQRAEADETDRKETIAKAMAVAFAANPLAASLKLADHAHQRALHWHRPASSPPAPPPPSFPPA